jgi:hypothetical protein
MHGLWVGRVGAKAQPDRSGFTGLDPNSYLRVEVLI